MFSSGPSYNKLKTNLRLCINRLKLLEKKKSEMTMKSRKEIADYMQAGKLERAKIRVEHIIREDYMVEAMEVIEMYCDLLLARFGLIQQMKTLDDGLAEAISSLIWVAPRMQADVQELKIVSDQFIAKYGKPYGQACRENAVGTVSAKLMHKLSVQAPPKITIEKYLIEIARYYNVDYEPDPQVMSQDEVYSADNLLDLAPPVPNKNDLDNNSGGGGGGSSGGFMFPPTYTPEQQSFQYPTPGGASAYPPPPSQPAPAAPFVYNIPPKFDLNNLNDEGAPPPYFPPEKPTKESRTAPPENNFLDLPDLPPVPGDTPAGGNTPQDGPDDDIDFDDLAKRFEALKKKK